MKNTSNTSKKLLLKASVAAAALTGMAAGQAEAQVFAPQMPAVSPQLWVKPQVANNVDAARAAAQQLVQDLNSNVASLRSFKADPVSYLDSNGFSRELQSEVLGELGGYDPVASGCICTGCCVSSVSFELQNALQMDVDAALYEVQQFQGLEHKLSLPRFP